MKKNRRTLSTVGVGVLAVLVGTLVLGATYVYRAGVVRVHVQEKQPDGTNIRLWVPGAVVPVAMRLVPEQYLQMDEEARRFLPAAAIATRELARVEDSVLVEVRNPHEQVRIAKQAGVLMIDVDNESEAVHVSVPLFVASSVLDHLQEQPPKK